MKNWIRFFGFSLIIVLCCWLVGFCVVKRDSVNRLKYHDFYQTDDYSVVAVGSSAVLNGFYPATADQLLGVKTFNMGTASQQMEGTYFQTLEVLRCQKVDTIILDVCFPIFSRAVGEPGAAQIMTDYMRGWNKVRFITETIPADQWLRMFSGLYRYHDASWEEVQNNIRAKLSPGYRRFEAENEFYTNYKSYHGLGYSEKEKENPGYDWFMFPEGYDSFNSLDAEIQPGQIAYLKKTIEACRKKNVNVLMVTFPKTEFYLKMAGDYTAMHNYVQSIADEYGVEYLDLNMICQDLWTDEMMANLDHCSVDSAKKSTEILCNYLLGSRPDCVERIQEKYLRDVVGILYTADYQENEDGDVERVCLSWRVDSDTDRKFLYRLIGQQEDTVTLDSGILEEPYAELSEMPEKLVLELYDKNMVYLGNAIRQ